MYNPPLEARYEVLRKRLGDAKRILDVGCGDGYLMKLASPLCKLVAGVDSEFAGIRLAASQLSSKSNCTAVQASCYNLPFISKSFDVITLADVFEHLEFPELCLREISRVLHPHGSLLLTTPKWRADRMWDRLHFKEYKVEELRDCLANYFRHVNMTFFWPLFWSNNYSTRFGFQLIRIFSRYAFNPFLNESDTPDKHGQILAVCEKIR